MFKGIVVGVVALCLLGAGGAALVLFVGLIPTNADAKPGTLERWVATTALEARLEREAPRQSSPLPPNDENLLAGVDLYEHHCVGCHGSADGQPSRFARGLYPPPPQLAEHGVEDEPQGFTYYKIDHGIRWSAMPAFGESLSGTQVWQLVLFLHQMDQLPAEAARAWRQENAAP